MTTIKFNGEEYAGEMTLKEFCDSLKIRNFQFFAHPNEFKKQKNDIRLKVICQELGINHI